MLLVNHRRDPLSSIILLISSCEQVYVSQLASVSEGKLRIYDYDERFEGNSFDLFDSDKEEGIS